MVAWIRLSESGHSYREFSVHWCKQGSLSLRRMSESRQRFNRCRLACVLSFVDPACCMIPTGGVFDLCSGQHRQATVGMMRAFADGEASAAARSHTCGTSCGHARFRHDGGDPHIANPVLQKNATPNHSKKKHRRTVIDPRRATTLTASSTFAGSDQFCVNAIASLPYNRVRQRM
jgi:hypothetical protein